MRLLLFLLPLLLAAQYNATIVRDKWGVPHISGKTDADAVYGLMKAQAEDNFWQLEVSTLSSIGRGAELGGEEALASDLRLRAFEVQRLAREEYARMEPWARALCDAYAAGINDYLKEHPETRPQRLAKWEPWFILANQLSSNAGLLNLNSLRLTPAEIAAAFPGAGVKTQPPAPPGEAEGSNMWAVSGKRTVSGKPLLLINPHVGWFGGGQRYEAVLRSRQGLHLNGFAILGTPYIRSGFSGHHGWSHTNNNASVADTWWDAPDGAREWQDTILVGAEARTVTFRKTAHGPVLAVRNGKLLAARVAKIEQGGVLEQRWLMGKARNLREFLAAMGRLALTGSNTLYADGAGNIWYVHGNAIPRRRPDGEWDGYHTLAELPQYLNPPSGYLQNCNSTPFLAAGEETLDRTKYPKYMVPEEDNLRAQRSRRILTSRPKWTYDQWAAAVLDTYVGAADQDLSKLLAVVEPDVAAELKKWDRVAAVDSIATTLFVRWRAMPDALVNPAGAWERLKASLLADWGTWQVRWGEVNRMQRVHTSGTQEPFSDARPSMPVAGCPGLQGCLFVVNGRKPAGAKRWYGFSGNSYVAIVEFTRKRRAASQLVFGQSADPASPHHTDQTVLFVERKFKDAETGRTIP